VALAYKARAMLAGLASLGEPSLLAGTPCGHALLQRDVDLFAGIGDTANDNHVVRYDIASVAARPEYADMLLGEPCGTTPSTYNPKVGQVLEHPEGNVRLDRLLRDNGFVRKFIVVPVPA
jgi:hypothetical protein